MSSALNRLLLRYQMTQVQVLCDSEEICETLKAYFVHFIADSEQSDVKYRHTLKTSLGESISLSAPVFSVAFKRGKFWGWLRQRKVLYENGGTLFFKKADKKEKVIEITAPTSEELLSLTFLMTQALWGEDMEREGYTRIHALTYQMREKAGLLAADSGLGKSTTALKLLSQPGVEVLSDEIAWVKSGRVYPYPIPIWEKSRDMPGRKKAHLPPPVAMKGFPLCEVFCVFHEKEMKLTGSFLLKLKFLSKVTIGHHLPQMTEVFLRGNNLFFLTGLFFRRFMSGIRLAFLPSTIFFVTPDYVPYEDFLSKSRVIGTPLFDHGV